MIQNLLFGVVYLLISGCLVDFQSQKNYQQRSFTQQYSFCWPSGLGNYFVCKRFALHLNPPVVTGICDPHKSQARPAQYSFLQKTSFYKTRLTQHYKKYTPIAQLKTLFTLQIF